MSTPSFPSTTDRVEAQGAVLEHFLRKVLHRLTTAAEEAETKAVAAAAAAAAAKATAEAEGKKKAGEEEAASAAAAAAATVWPMGEQG